jgi:hypothetical protein
MDLSLLHAFTLSFRLREECRRRIPLILHALRFLCYKVKLVLSRFSGEWVLFESALSVVVVAVAAGSGLLFPVEVADRLDASCAAWSAFCEPALCGVECAVCGDLLDLFLACGFGFRGCGLVVLFCCGFGLLVGFGFLGSYNLLLCVGMLEDTR